MTDKSAPLDTLFIPAADKSSRRLWVMLHGLGDSVEGYRGMPQIFNLPWMNYLLVNAPDEYYMGFSWYDFTYDGNPEVMRPGVERSRPLLFQVLDAQRAAGFTSEQTILGGFSQGCVMSLDVASRYPHKLAGVVGISGYVCEPEKLVKELSPVAKEQRFVMTHGTYDPVVPIDRAREQVKLLQAAGLNIGWHEFAKDHSFGTREEVELLRDFVSGCFA